MAASTGRWLTYLRAGDVLYPTHIESLLALGDSDTSVVCASLNEAVCWYNGGQDVALVRSTPFKGRLDLNLLKAEPVFRAPAFAHERSCIDAVSVFDPAYGMLTDWDFLLRLTDQYATALTETISAERRLCVGICPGGDTSLIELLEGEAAAFQMIYSRHDVADSSLQRLRRQALLDLNQKTADLKWIAAQDWDRLKKAKQMASVWLGLESSVP